MQHIEVMKLSHFIASIVEKDRTDKCRKLARSHMI